MLEDTFFVVRIARISIVKEMNLDTCQCWERCFKNYNEHVFALFLLEPAVKCLRWEGCVW